jgi:hypothetical protein
MRTIRPVTVPATPRSSDSQNQRQAAAPPIGELVVGPGSGPPERVVANLRSVRTPGGRFLVPDASPRAAARSLLAYNRLRPRKVRATRAALAALAGTGATRLTARPVEIRAPRDAPLLLDHLAAELGEPALLFATTEQAGRGFQTPMLQLFTPAGQPVGFAKVGWDAVTAGLVDTEADMLRRAAALTTVRVPEVRWHGRWNDLTVLVTAPMPAGVHRLPAAQLPPLAPLPEIAALDRPLHRQAIASSAYWAAARATAAAADGDPALAAEVEAIEAEAGAAEVAFGRWHGVWVEWNLATDHGALWCWDWAYSAPDVPYGFDALQFFFLRHRNVHHLPDAAALDRAAADAAPALARLGLDADERRAVTRVHRIELALRFARAAQARARTTTA